MLTHDRFICVNRLRLHYLEWGEASAPPVVVLHGGSAHAHWWDYFAQAIADQYHVFALDLRGHGDSEHPDPPTYRLDDYARDLAAFLDMLALPSIDLVGHSFGAMVATAYAGVAPARPNSLVVVDAQVKITPAGARYMTRLRNFPHPVYRTREQAIRRFRLLPKHTEADEKILAHVALHGVRQLPDGCYTLKFDRDAMAQHEPHDLTPILQRLGCPILFVRGAHSTLLSHATLTTLLSIVPHAEGVEIADAHHHVMLDNPAAFAGAVRAFLDRNQRTTDDRSPTADHRPARQQTT